MFSNREIETMRSEAVVHMEQTADWTSVTHICGDDGGVVNSHVYLGQLPCKVVHCNAPKQTNLGSEVANVLWCKILLPYGTDVNVGDHLAVDGHLYCVDGVDVHEPRLQVMATCCEVD